MIAWFCIAGPDGPLIDADQVAALVEAVPGLASGCVFTPARAHDPYLDDGAPPALALQLDFAAIEPLEAALREDGDLQALVPLLAGHEVEEQAMMRRRFPVPEPSDADRVCTYLVGYAGPAADLNAWLAHYIGHHPAIMARFPGIRAIEIFTRLDWVSALPFRRGDAMQRNKVAFDDEAALAAALASPVRHEMRADFARFPRFSGAVTHFPMSTRVIPGR